MRKKNSFIDIRNDRNNDNSKAKLPLFTVFMKVILFFIEICISLQALFILFHIKWNTSIRSGWCKRKSVFPCGTEGLQGWLIPGTRPVYIVNVRRTNIGFLSSLSWALRPQKLSPSYRQKLQAAPESKRTFSLSFKESSPVLFIASAAIEFQ